MRTTMRRITGTALTLLLAVRLDAQAVSRQRSFDVTETTIATIHSAMRAHTLTCRQLVTAYLARIDAVDKRGAAINALIVVNPAALAVADSLDKRFAKEGL